MELKPLAPADEPLWDAFCLANGDAWFWHTSGRLRYQTARQKEAVPLHFFVARENKIIAICPLILQTIQTPGGTVPVFGPGNDFLPAPVAADVLQPSDRERTLRTVFEEIDRLAAEHGAAKASFRSLPLSPRYLAPAIAPANDLARFGYLDASLDTQVLDLRPDEKTIWSGFRKSYHSLIRRTEERFSYRLIDAGLVTPEIFETYPRLHQKAAGRQTRSPETFQMMREWVETGRAFLSQALDGERVVGCDLIITYKNYAYYGSACNDPDYDVEWALGHFLQWKVMQTLKSRGVTYYELGWQYPGPPLSYAPTAEERQIAFFKRGFGGLSLPFHRGEKYYSRDLFIAEYQQRLQSIAHSWPERPQKQPVPN